jgi:hypothetical protein
MNMRMTMPKNLPISGTSRHSTAHPRGQWLARRHGIAGIYGNGGNVESISYRI